MNSKVISKLAGSTLSVILWLLIVIQVTDLFRMPLLFGVSLTTVAALTLALTSIYIAGNFSIVKTLAGHLVTKLIFAIKIAIPLVLGAIHYLQGFLPLSGIVRPFLLNVLFFNLFLVTAIGFYRWSRFTLRLCVGVIVVTVLIGLGLNYVFPEFFYAIKLAVWGIEKDLSQIEVAGIHRTAGFYLKSTGAAASMLLLYPAALSVFGKNVAAVFVSFVILMGCIFLTGARSGIAITLLIAPLLWLTLVRYINVQKRVNTKNSVRLGFAIVPLLFITLAGVGAVAIKSAEKYNLDSLTDRVSSLTDASRIQNDESLNQRSTAQGKYLNFIKYQPLTGYGPTYSKRLKQEGYLWLSSHNTYIEESFDYGLIFFLCYCTMIGVLIMGFVNKGYLDYSFVDFITVFGIIVFAYSFFSSTLMENRTLFFTLGVAVGLAIRGREGQSFAARNTLNDGANA